MTAAKRSVEDAPLNAFHRRLTIYSAGGPFLDGYVLSIIGVAMLLRVGGEEPGAGCWPVPWCPVRCS